MANGSNTPPINVGLNLQGNALGTVDQLTQRMITLRNTAKEVGDSLALIDKNIKALEGKNAKSPTNQTLKNLRQQMDLMSTSPDMLMQRYYQNLNKANQAAQVNQLVNSKRQFTNSNTMNSMLQQYDPKTVKQALEIRKTAADLSGDIKKVKAAELALVQYKNTLKQLNTEFKGLAYIRQQQDASIQNLMRLPAGTAAINNNINGRNMNQFATGAKESAINKYMQNPSAMVPSNRTLVNLTPEQLRQEMQANASKMAAAQRTMGQLYLQDPAKNPAVSQQLNQYSQVLAKLEEEKTKLQAINTLRRTSLKTTDEQIKKLQTSNDIIKNNQRLEQLTSGNLNVKTLSAERIAQLAPTDLIARQETMTKRLAQAKAVMHRADELGNKKAQEDAAKLVEAYRKEVEMLKAKAKANADANRTNPMVDRYNQMNTGESSGALLGMQGLLMRNYMIWGAFMGSITGSYAFLRDFEVALKQTQAISQATDTQMQGLKESILEVGENSRFTAIEITEAATALAQAGFSMSEIETTLESVTLLATATGSTLKETVDIATASLGAFQLSAENMPKIVNQITQAMNLSKLDIQKFQLAVQYAGNAASDAGLNFEELLATVATAANAGIRSGSTLGTGFRQLLSDLVAPSTKFDSILTRLGLTAADVDVRTNGLVGSLKKLKEAGFTTADAYESFEVRSVAFYTAISNNLAAYDDLTANLDNNTAAQEANEIQMNSLGAQTDRMFNQFKALAEVAGSGVRETLTDLFHIIGDLTTVLKDATDNGVIRFAVKTAVLAVALGGTIYLIKGAGAALAGLVLNIRNAAAAKTALAGAATATGVAFRFAFPQIAAISAVIAVAILGFKALTGSNNDLKDSVEAGQTALNKLKDSTSNLQTSIVEVDKKITSLESRFESLREDPAAVAVEFTNLQMKASELGVVLSVDLTGGIDSVRKGWEMLRNELSKSLIIDLSQQIEEIDLLSQKMLSLKVQEAAAKPDIFSEKGAEDNGYGTVVDFKTLKRMEDIPLAAATDKNAYVRRNNAKNSGQTYNSNLFKAISDANLAGGGVGRDIDVEALFKKIANNPKDLTLMTPEEQEKAIPSMRQDYLRANAVINNAKKEFIRASRETKDLKERKAAETMVETLINFQNQMAERGGVVNQLFSSINQRKSLTSQRDVETETVNIRSALISGDVSDLTKKSDFGNAYALGKQGKAKEKYNTRELAELMPSIKALSKKYGVPEDLIIGHLITESGVNQNVTSEAGAMGLMQIMPNTAKDMGLDVGRVKEDKLYNLEGGVRYLAKMKKDTNGTWEDASRAYFMGAGGLNKYKATNGKSYGKGYNQSTQYAKTVYANTLNFQKTRGGRYSIMEELDIPENTQTALSEIETLNSIIDGAKAQIASKGDISKLSESDKALVAKWSAQIQAAEKLVSTRSADTNNVIRAAQTRDKAERERMKGFKQIDIQKLKDTVSLLEFDIAETESKLNKGEFSKENIEQLKTLNSQLLDAQKKQLAMESEVKLLAATTYDGKNLVVDVTFQELEDMQLSSAYKKAELTLDKKLKATLEAALKAFSEKIKQQNAEFREQMKEELLNLDEPYQDALKINEFNKQKSTWELEDQLGLTEMRNRRAGMDDPRMKDMFTNAEREDLDLAIQYQTGRVAEVNQIYTQAELDSTLQQTALVQKAVAEQEIKLAEFQAKQSKLLTDNLTGDELRSAQIALDKEMRKVKNDLSGSQGMLIELEKKARSLQNELAAASPDIPADRYNLADAAKSIARRAVRNDESTAGQERDLESTIGGINSAFHNLINTAIDASDNVDDFFKIITGGSGKSREAFKAFGYEIISTIAKVVQNRLVNKFVDMMVGFIFGGANQSSSAAQSAQHMGQGGSANNGSGWWQQGLGTLIQAGVGAVAGYFGGGATAGGAVTQAGAQSSGATTYGLGANYNNSGISVTRMAHGGEVVGGTPNTDSVPVLSMPGEYYLPKTTTSVLGREFLDTLKDDPNGMMKALKGTNLSQRPTIDKKVESNIYIVAPSAVPSTVGPNDIVTAVSDNISRNGELKQLIKRVMAE